LIEWKGVVNMFRKKILLAVVLVLALSVLASAVYANGLARATGSAHFYFGNGTYATSTFSAIEHADGSVSGQVQTVVHSNPQAIGHIAVDCLQIVEGSIFGDVAIMSGWLTQAINLSPGVPIPGYATYAVADGGEGPEAIDVIASSIYVVSDPATFNCENATLGPLLPLRIPINGDIQVYP
jgi:hypothetical protein